MQVRSLSALAAAPLLLCGGPLAHLLMELWCVHVAQRGKRREHSTLHAAIIAAPLSVGSLQVRNWRIEGGWGKHGAENHHPPVIVAVLQPPCCWAKLQRVRNRERAEKSTVEMIVRSMSMLRSRRRYGDKETASRRLGDWPPAFATLTQM